MTAGFDCGTLSVDLHGAVAVVTGSARGLGAVIGETFARSGAHVVFSGRSEASPDRLARQMVGAASSSYFRGDISHELNARQLIQTALRDFGGIDILINNAGTRRAGDLMSATTEDIDTTFADNVRTVSLCTRAAATAMIEQGRGGSVVNVASIRADRPGAASPHYAAAKAAVVALTRSNAEALGPFGIRVNAVSPGLIDRAGLQEDWPDGIERYRAIAPLGQIGNATDVAMACLFLCSTAARWITGTNLVVDGGFSVARP